jgi:hypothetical protein
MLRPLLGSKIEQYLPGLVYHVTPEKSGVDDATEVDFFIFIKFDPRPRFPLVHEKQMSEFL